MEQALTKSSRPHPVPVVNRTPLQAVDHPINSAGPSVAYLPAPNTPCARPAGEMQADGCAFTDSGSGSSGSDGSVVQGHDDGDPGDETPGRSPRRTTTHPASAAEVSSRSIASRERTIAEPHALLAGSNDPLGEGLGLLAGMAIGLLTLVVPLLSVVNDRQAIPALSEVETHFHASRQP